MAEKGHEDDDPELDELLSGKYSTRRVKLSRELQMHWTILEKLYQHHVILYRPRKTLQMN